MVDSLTPNAGLSIITPTRNNWADAMNNNLRILDTIVGAYFTVNSLRGIWMNSTEYAVDDSVIDTDTGTLFQALEAHVSSAIPTTFSEERAANPTRWGTYAAPARSRGTWLPNTSYLRNDFVVSGTQYAIALENHTSGAIFSVDVAANKWSILVDLSAAGSQVLPVPGVADANKFTMVNGTGNGYTILGLAAVLSIMGVTSVGQAVMQAASAGDARSAINAQVAGSYQPLSAYLTLIGTLGVTASRFPYVDAAGLAALGITGAFGISWMALADLAAAKVALGLGTAAFIDVGVAANKVVQFDGSGKYPAADGSAITGIATVAAATQAEQETGSATNVYTSPGRQHFHASAAKAWAKADSAGAISVSYNMSSVTDVGTGIITFNFTNSLSSANYVPLSNARASAFVATTYILDSTPPTSAGFTIICVNTASGAATDPVAYSAACFGDM